MSYAGFGLLQPIPSILASHSPAWRLAIALAIAFVLATILVPVAMILACRFRIVADPHAKSGRDDPIPLLGGMPIIVAVLIALGLLKLLPLWLCLGASGLLSVGVVDDIVGLEPPTKLLLEAVFVTAAVLLWRSPALLPWPALNHAVLIVWLLTTVNAFNLIDGLDGLAGGVGICAALTVSSIGILRQDWRLASESLAVAGGIGGFLSFNLPPARIFMGDTGALPLGFLLGALAFEAGSVGLDQSRLTQAAIPILIMLAPLLDITMVSVCRILTDKPVTRRGLDHSHHKLLALGLADRVAVWICWTVATLAGACAVTIAVMPNAYVLTILPFLVAILGPVAFFIVDLTFDRGQPNVAVDQTSGFRRWLIGFGYKRRLTEIALDCAIITAAYFGAFLIRFDFVMTDQRMAQLLPNLPWILIASFSAFLFAGVYRGMWPYAGLADLSRFLGASVGAGLLLVVFWNFTRIMLSGSILLLFIILLFNLLSASRLSFRAFRAGIHSLSNAKRRILIVGTGATAEAAIRFLGSGCDEGMQVVGFIGDDPHNVGKIMHGLGILGTLIDLEEIHRETSFTEMMLAGEEHNVAEPEFLRQFAEKRSIPIMNFTIVVKEIGSSDNILALNRSGEILSGEVLASKNLLV